jgi:hypothetical protein
MNKQKVKRKIEGTVKFEIYLYRAKAVRKKKIREPKDFIYKQGGVIVIRSESQDVIASKMFSNFGGMINIMSKFMRKTVMNDLKEKNIGK